MLNNSIWLIDRTLSGATIQGKSEPGSNVNEGILSIPHRPSITVASPSDCIVSLVGESTPL